MAARSGPSGAAPIAETGVWEVRGDRVRRASFRIEEPRSMRVTALTSHTPGLGIGAAPLGPEQRPHAFGSSSHVAITASSASGQWDPFAVDVQGGLRRPGCRSGSWRGCPVTPSDRLGKLLERRGTRVGHGGAPYGAQRRESAVRPSRRSMTRSSGSRCRRCSATVRRWQTAGSASRHMSAVGGAPARSSAASSSRAAAPSSCSMYPESAARPRPPACSCSTTGCPAASRARGGAGSSMPCSASDSPSLVFDMPARRDWGR